eukprot:366000-Chlamydomonas_euryale.AAC.20
MEERCFFRIRNAATHAEVMLYLSCFATVYSGAVLIISGEVWEAIPHSMRHTATVPMICTFSVMGYVTVCLILLIIKNFGATNAEIVKSLRKVFQVAVSFLLFPKASTGSVILIAFPVPMPCQDVMLSGGLGCACNAEQLCFPSYLQALTPKYVIGGLLVTMALWWLQRSGKAQNQQQQQQLPLSVHQQQQLKEQPMERQADG